MFWKHYAQPETDGINEPAVLRLQDKNISKISFMFFRLFIVSKCLRVDMATAVPSPDCQVSATPLRLDLHFNFT